MTKIFRLLWGNCITLLCTAVIAALAALSWQTLATPLPYAAMQRAEYAVIEGSPQYKDIIAFRADDFAWQPYDYPAPPPMPEGAQTIYLSWQIPANVPPLVNHILFATTNQNACVYLDDELVYIHGAWDDPAAARGRTLHFIHIGKDLAGKRLTIMLHTGYRNWLGSLDYFLLGSEKTLIRKISIADAIFIASLSIALSLIVFLVMDLAWRGIRRQRQRQLYLIAFLMSFILWASGTSSFFPRIFGQPGLWWELHLIMLYVMPITFAKITQEIAAPQFTKAVRSTMIVYLLFFAAATIGEVAGLDGYMNLLYLFYPLLLVSCFILLYALLRSPWKKYPACRHGMVAMLSLTVFVGIDALHWEYHLLSSMLSTTIYSIYATIPFVFFLIRQQMQRDAHLARQNASLARELEETQNEAQRDFLTGAYNRHQLADGVAKYSALANTRGFSFSFAIFDVDHFKTVNDTKGHLAGDQILKQIAAVVHAKTDRRHIFIRYGGDEFILLALHYDLAQMAVFCEDLRRTLAQTLGGVTLSFGVSTWHGTGDHMTPLMNRADRALYRSKEKGRNTVSTEDECADAPPH